ncbi:MAG: hypothetical protein EOO61_19700 [Hymenobacter sp.]|nr:MAG: hypothetical protein EOO61_19700 [Hymenobacter sp.]
MKLLSLLFLMLLPFRKQIVEKYEGGSRYHTQLILTLFSDSIFTYSFWSHSPSKTHIFKGIWHKKSGQLILDSKKKNEAFHNESFVLKGDTIHFYSKEDSVKNYRYYKEFFTLVRKP